MDPDEVAFGQLAPDRCEVERNYEDATSCQVDAGITSGSLYPLDFVHCRFEIVVLSPDKDILPFRTSFVDVSFFTIGRHRHSLSSILREPLTIRIGNSSEPSGRTITSC